MEESSAYYATRTLFESILVLGDAFGLVLVGLILAYTINDGSGFSWSESSSLVNVHIVLMGIFMIFLQGNASLVYRILPSNPKFLNKLIHATLHFFVCIGIIVGLVAIVHSKQLSDDSNFTTVHSWLGIITIVTYFIQFIVGFSLYLFPGATIETKVNALPIHKFVGRSLFVFAVATIVAGIMQISGSSRDENSTISKIAGLFGVLYVVCMLYLMSDYAFRRRPAPFQLIESSTAEQRLFYGSTVDYNLPTTSSKNEKVVY